MTPDFDPAFLAFLEATAPAGVKVLLAADDATFVGEMRDAFHLRLADDLVLMASDGRQTWVVMPPTRRAAGLLLTFFDKGGGNFTLLPTLVTTNPREGAPWRDASYSTQAVIDAWESLLFRRVMPTAGGVQ